MKDKNERFLKAVDLLYQKKLVNSQKQLAEKIGITESALSRIKNGSKIVSDETIRKMNAAFDNMFNMDFFRGVEGAALTEVTAIQQKTVSNLPDSRNQSTSEVVELLKEQIQILKNQLADKDRLIKLLEHRVSGLEIDMEHYRDPKPVGVTENALR